VVVAAAAAIALFVSPLRQEPSATPLGPAPARPRSTVDLFADGFETRTTSERMDAIASARARDLRDNRYSAWGVR
jgi:hypothetical protein